MHVHLYLERAIFFDHNVAGFQVLRCGQNETETETAPQGLELHTLCMYISTDTAYTGMHTHVLLFLVADKTLYM